MDALAEKLDHDILDIARSRAAEQEVLDLLDEPLTHAAVKVREADD